MSSKVDTDIFLKSLTKDPMEDDINVSSSLFTTTTPSKLGKLIPDTTDSAYITKDIIKLHKKILDSDLIPESYSQSHSSQTGGATSAMSTADLPINYSESSMTDSSAMRSAMKYAYHDLIPDAKYSTPSSSQYSSSSSNSSTSSSSSSSSSTSSSEPKKTKQYRTVHKKSIPKKKTTSKKTTPKKTTPKKTVSKKTTSKKTIPKKK